MVATAMAETSVDGRTLLTADSEDGVRKWDFLDFNIDWLAVRNIAMPLITKFTFRTNGTCLSPRYSPHSLSLPISPTPLYFTRFNALNKRVASPPLLTTHPLGPFNSLPLPCISGSPVSAGATSVPTLIGPRSRPRS